MLQKLAWRWCGFPQAAPRRLALLFLFAFFCAGAAGAERVPAKLWRKVKIYDMQTLQAMEPLPMRRIVGVRFNYRSKEMRHLKPNWFYSSIWSVTRRAEKAEFSNIPVMVAKADLESFQALPTDFQTTGKYIIYGQVLRDREAGFLFLRVLGAKVKRDKRGHALVGW